MILFLLSLLCSSTLLASEQYSKDESRKLFNYVHNTVINCDRLSKSIIEEYQHNGADINMPLETGTLYPIQVNCIHHALFHRRNPHNSLNADILIQCGADIHSKNYEGRSLLQHAIDGAHEPLLIKTLLQHNANPNEKIDFRAMDFNHHTNASLLMLCAHNAAMPYQVDSERCTSEMAKHLIDYGAHINAQDDCKYTALHHISDLQEEWTCEFVTTFLDHGANPFIKDRRETAFAETATYVTCYKSLMRNWLKKHKNSYEGFRELKKITHDKHAIYKHVGNPPLLPKQALLIIFEHLNLPWRYEDQIDPDNFDIEKYK